MDALLIIDFQRAVFQGSPATYRAAEVGVTLDTLATRMRACGLPVLYLRHSDPGTLWDRSAAGWPIHELLAPKPGDEVIDKQSSDGFRDTRLAEILQQRAIGGLFIGGYATEFCVDSTIRAAASRGVRVVAVTDGHTTRDRESLNAPAIVAHHNWVWPRIANPGNPIEVRSSAQVLNEIAAR